MCVCVCSVGEGEEGGGRREGGEWPLATKLSVNRTQTFALFLPSSVFYPLACSAGATPKGVLVIIIASPLPLAAIHPDFVDQTTLTAISHI